jgi:hypothetical protein
MQKLKDRLKDGLSRLFSLRHPIWEMDMKFMKCTYFQGSTMQGDHRLHKNVQVASAIAKQGMRFSSN